MSGNLRTHDCTFTVLFVYASSTPPCSEVQDLPSVGDPANRDKVMLMQADAKCCKGKYVGRPLRVRIE